MTKVELVILERLNQLHERIKELEHRLHNIEDDCEYCGSGYIECHRPATEWNGDRD